jgi:hypothetical protein
MALFDLDMIKKVYENMPSRIAAARDVLGKPLTLSEFVKFKIGENSNFFKFMYYINLRRFFYKGCS